MHTIKILEASWIYNELHFKNRKVQSESKVSLFELLHALKNKIDVLKTYMYLRTNMTKLYQNGQRCNARKP